MERIQDGWWRVGGVRSVSPRGLRTDDESPTSWGVIRKSSGRSPSAWFCSIWIWSVRKQSLRPGWKLVFMPPRNLVWDWFGRLTTIWFTRFLSPHRIRLTPIYGRWHLTTTAGLWGLRSVLPLPRTRYRAPAPAQTVNASFTRKTS